MIDYASLVGAGNNHLRPIIFIYVIKIDTQCWACIVSVWIECPVRMSFNRRTIPRRFHIHFIILDPNTGTNNLLYGV